MRWGSKMATPKERKQYRSWVTRQRLAGYTFRRLRLSSEMTEQLKARAAENKTSVRELILTYIEWGLENDCEIQIRK